MADATRRSTRFSMRSKQLGQLLLENGDLQAEQVAKALKIQEQKGGMIGRILRGQGVVDDAQIAAALLKQVQVTDIRCEEVSVDPEVAALVPRETCETEKLCPIERLGNLLCIVMGNPLNRRAITQIEEKVHLKVKSFKSKWPDINELIQRTYNEDGTPNASGDAQPTGSQEELVAADAGAEDAVAETGSALPPLELENASAPVEVQEPLEIPEPPVIQRSAPAARRAPAPAAPAEPKIQGIDNLNDDSAELIETNRRGLTKRMQAQSRVVDDEAPVKKPEKKAKVNVDLDALDLASGEVVRGPDDAPEGMEEIVAQPLPNKPLERHAGEIVALKLVNDGYFYSDNKAPGRKRSDELNQLVETLPIGEVVAQSIGEYEAMKAPAQEKAPAPKPVEKPVLKASPAAANRPLELQPSPAAVLTAILISESEFQKTVAALGEDPVGEWDWHYSAQGPVPVLVYEEN